jgi:hypothetical protein
MATVLVALCAVLSAGAALAQADWDVTDQDFPTYLQWEESAAVSVTAENTGTTVWDATYDLRSVDGPTGTMAIGRWGLTFAPPTGMSVAIGAETTVGFTIVAPPITSLGYDPADLGAPMADGLACTWRLASNGLVLSVTDDEVAGDDIVLGTFTDLGGSWAGPAVEECAGLIEPIVRGYPDGSYQPAIQVTRDQMAVYIRRGMKIDKLVPAEASFEDVPLDHWASGDVEALVDAEVVQGYADELYHPGWKVTRGQMAVYIFRANAYVAPEDEDIEARYEAFLEWYEDPDRVPPPPEPVGLLDIPPGFWCDGEVYACVDNDVVKGYADYKYRPAVFVTREQMAVYMYRAFIQPTDAAVVVAGPDVSDLDPTAAGYHGIQGVDTDPGFAYVGFDAARLGTTLAVGGSWQVEFKFLVGEGPTVADVVTISVTEAEITDANDAVAATGDPYFYVVTPISLVSTGVHTLVVSVEDSDGTMKELPRRVTFELLAPPPPPGSPRTPSATGDAAFNALAGDSRPGAAPFGGGWGAMMASDDSYFILKNMQLPITSWAAGGGCCENTGLTLKWTGVEVPVGATECVLRLEYHVGGTDLDQNGMPCCSNNMCEEWGSPWIDGVHVCYGWGLIMVNYADVWDWDGSGTGSPSAEIQDTPAEGGLGGMFAYHPFGNTPAADVAMTWTVSDWTNFLNGDEMMVHFCGGGTTPYWYIDQCTIEFNPH